MALLIKVNGDFIELKPRYTNELQHDEIFDAIGGYPDSYELSTGVFLWVRAENTDGKIEGLEINKRATDMLFIHNAGRSFCKKPKIIYGDVVIM